ncbi:MHS family MFS transporter [Thermoleophilia bacterium SCSIO 60948]|nr:MHS family MFS transporter [Thermoleophilia bacterium SCSIO 60948]
MQSASTAGSAPPAVDAAGRRKVLGAGLVGSSLEWYDFFIYATAAALVFPAVFFPDSSAVTGTLLSFSTFWAGFLARPIGGIVVGHLGDKFGRKPAVVGCLLLMGIATFTIGVLPSAATIGVFAPILLVTMRFLQGFAVGGQWGGLALLTIESASPKRRGFAGTFAQMGVPLGVILGNSAFLIVGAVLSEAAFAGWGWRVPFLLSALLIPVGLFVQMRVEETPAFKEAKAEAESRKQGVVQAPLAEAIKTKWRTILLGAGILFVTNAIFYVSIAGVLDYGTRELGLERNALLAAILVSSTITIAGILLAGRWSDKVGRRLPTIIGAGLLTLVAFPFFWLIDTGSIVLVGVALILGGIGTSLTYGPAAAFLGELYEARMRYSGASLSYQLAAILISGGTPFITTALLEATGTSAAVSGFLFILGLITLFCAIKLPETAPAKLEERRASRPKPSASPATAEAS